MQDFFREYMLFLRRILFHNFFELFFFFCLVFFNRLFVLDYLAKDLLIFFFIFSIKNSTTRQHNSLWNHAFSNNNIIPRRHFVATPKTLVSMIFLIFSVFFSQNPCQIVFLLGLKRAVHELLLVLLQKGPLFCFVFLPPNHQVPLTIYYILILHVLQQSMLCTLTLVHLVLKHISICLQ